MRLFAPAATPSRQAARSEHVGHGCPLPLRLLHIPKGGDGDAAGRAGHLGGTFGAATAATTSLLHAARQRLLLLALQPCIAPHKAKVHNELAEAGKGLGTAGEQARPLSPLSDQSTALGTMQTLRD